MRRIVGTIVVITLKAKYFISSKELMDIKKLIEKEHFSRDEIIRMLETVSSDALLRLFERATRVRNTWCGDEVHIRGVIDISNHCESNCLFCSMREDNFSLERYRMSAPEVVEAAKRAVSKGLRTIVLSSGEDNYYDPDIISYMIYSIKQLSDVAITLALGSRGFDEYRTWKIAGADRYLLKHETANRELYRQYHNKKLQNERIQHLRYLKRIGFEAGSGILVGLPHQTNEDIADDILLASELELDKLIIEPFIPAPFTPYQNYSAADLTRCLKVIAIARIVLKDIHIATSHLIDIVSENSREIALNCGANNIFQNYTPENYSGLCEPSPGKNLNRGISRKLEQHIESIGQSISFNRGDSYKVKKLI